MTHADREPDPETPFGEALLDALRASGVPLTGLSYAEIQEMKPLGREEAIAMLRRNVSLSYAMIQIIKTKSPQEIAEWIHDQHVATAQTVGNMVPFIIMMSLM